MSDPAVARAAYRTLIAAVAEDTIAESALKAALAAFFETMSRVPMAAEFRDEIVQLGADVCAARGGSRARALALAERALA